MVCIANMDETCKIRPRYKVGESKKVEKILVRLPSAQRRHCFITCWKLCGLYVYDLQICRLRWFEIKNFNMATIAAIIVLGATPFPFRQMIFGIPSYSF